VILTVKQDCLTSDQGAMKVNFTVT
jgi:hypothetical protein